MRSKILAGMPSSAPPPGGDTWGFNFRSTDAYVTDGPDEESVTSSKYRYPETWHGGAVTAGFDRDVASNFRNRSQSVDPRLAGIIFYTPNLGLYFRMDLAPGTWQLEIGAGDAGDWNNADFQIWDGIPNSGTMIDEVVNGTAQIQFFDAHGNGPFTASTWPSNQQQRGVTVTDRGADTCLCIVWGRPAVSGGNTTLAHIKVSN